MTDESNIADNSNEWITPVEVSQRYNIKLRTVYRLIERNKITARGEKRSLRINVASVSEFIEEEKERNARANVEQIIASQEPESRSQAAREYRESFSTQLMVLQEERRQLQTQIIDANSARLRDAKEIGELSGRLTQIERELVRLEKGNNRLQIAIAVLIFVVIAILLILLLTGIR